MKCANSSVCFNKYSNLFARSVCIFSSYVGSGSWISFCFPGDASSNTSSISASAGPAPASHDGAAGAATPSGPPLLPLPLLPLLPPAPAAAALEGALSGGGGGGGSAADDMFRLRHPPRPRAGAVRRGAKAAWACAAPAPEERTPPGSSHAQAAPPPTRAGPGRGARPPRRPLPRDSAPLHRRRLLRGGNHVDEGGRGQRGHGGSGRAG